MFVCFAMYIVHPKYLHFVDVVGGGQLSSHQKFLSPLFLHFAPNSCDAKSAPHSCLAQVELIRITSSRIKEGGPSVAFSNTY